MMHSESDFYLPFAEFDLKVGIHKMVAGALFKQQWEMAHHIAVAAKEEIAETGYQPDGLLVKAGESWLNKFKEQEPIEG
jgi:hypothetical protein